MEPPPSPKSQLTNIQKEKISYRHRVSDKKPKYTVWLTYNIIQIET